MAGPASVSPEAPPSPGKWETAQATPLSRQPRTAPAVSAVTTRGVVAEGAVGERAVEGGDVGDRGEVEVDPVGLERLARRQRPGLGRGGRPDRPTSSSLSGGGRSA